MLPCGRLTVLGLPSPEHLEYLTRLPPRWRHGLACRLACSECSAVHQMQQGLLHLLGQRASWPGRRRHRRKLLRSLGAGLSAALAESVHIGDNVVSLVRGPPGKTYSGPSERSLPPNWECCDRASRGGKTFRSRRGTLPAKKGWALARSLPEAKARCPGGPPTIVELLHCCYQPGCPAFPETTTCQFPF